MAAGTAEEFLALPDELSSEEEQLADTAVGVPHEVDPAPEGVPAAGRLAASQRAVPPKPQRVKTGRIRLDQPCGQSHSMGTCGGTLSDGFPAPEPWEKDWCACIGQSHEVLTCLSAWLKIAYFF